MKNYTETIKQHRENDVREYNNIKFERCGDPLTPRIIDSFCYGAKLPIDYENFFCEINGGTPDKNVFDCDCKGEGDIISRFWGASIGNCIGYEHSDRGKIIPARMIVVADATEGNLILMSLKNPDRGKIYHFDSSFESEFTDPEKVGSEDLTLIANNFDEFLSMLYPEGDLYNEDEIYKNIESEILRIFNESSIDDVLQNKLETLLTNHLGYAICILQRVFECENFDNFRKMFNSVKPKQSKYFLNEFYKCYPELNEKISILREDISKW